MIRRPGRMPTKYDNQGSYKEGKEAALDGQTIDLNPYEPGTLEHGNWWDGFVAFRDNKALIEKRRREKRGLAK